MEALISNPDGVYIDATFGGGGHSRAILKVLSENGKLIAFDQDKDVPFQQIKSPHFHFVSSNFVHLTVTLQNLGISSVDGILADLGVSSHQLNTVSRGFSYRFNAPLDMRMNVEQKCSAFDVINTYSPQKLYLIFKCYGEVHNPKILTDCIVQARKLRPITTTFDLINAIQKITPKHKEYGYYAKVFQAIRIEVNQELENLKSFLLQTTNVLSTKGRLVVLTYHSLEDRIVKNVMQYGNAEGAPQKDIYGNITRPFLPLRKPILPTQQEIENNPRARSAKLRVAEKI
ncbi:MAG: 16S rRNA (cytosine(1402)-N(4))-methyltransferase RsmH [Bacteroidia bacterium]|nr:16S rRNA (cytosine(1402)-N(4))-methyltransferase RsmH [Bacteroidia bacterium]